MCFSLYLKDKVGFLNYRSLMVGSCPSQIKSLVFFPGFKNLFTFFSFSFSQITRHQNASNFSVFLSNKSTYHHRLCLLWRTSFGSEQNEIRSKLFFSTSGTDWFDWIIANSCLYCLTTIGFHKILNIHLENYGCRNFNYPSEFISQCCTFCSVPKALKQLQNQNQNNLK